MSLPEGPLVECVPNVSEGRRQGIIDELVAVVSDTPGTCVLDLHTDPDHNRSVITFAGNPAAVRQAAIDLARTAVRLIDMRRHVGVHPRIGAVDVIPFVPLGGTTMAVCTGLAREVAAAVAAADGIPAYLYASAATAPRTLAHLRAGQFEGLLAQGLRYPPDFGPGAAHPTAGAVAVGARAPLVAFNMLLDTGDVTKARSVARSLRESSGGLPGVQALGLYLPGRAAAQVSTNVLDHERTSLAHLLETTLREAAAHDTGVVSAELVGLAPAVALEGLEQFTMPGIPGAPDSIEAHLAACAG